MVRHDRLRPGLNHLAFYAASREHVDSLWRYAPEHGWRLLFADRHPHAGGPDHYAAYLENADGFEVEIVAPVSEAAKLDAGPGQAPAPPPLPADPAPPAGPVQPAVPPGPGPV